MMICREFLIDALLRDSLWHHSHEEFSAMTLCWQDRCPCWRQSSSILLHALLRMEFIIVVKSIALAGDNLRASFGWKISPEELAVAVDSWAGVSVCERESV